jgi:hypothetical protein
LNSIRIAGKYLGIGWLLLCIIGEGHSRICPKEYIHISSVPTEHVVQLRYATLPSVLRVVSIHYWFVTFEPETGQWHRWEVWQEPDVRGTSWRYVHKDLMPPASGVGGGSSVVAKEWRGETAREIISILNTSSIYPDRNIYRVWPGPNSNTYVAWVLRQSNEWADLHPMGVGKDYFGIIGVGLSTTKTGLQLESPLSGLKVGLRDGLEVHIFSLTIGIDILPPAIKTPLGRVGFSEL